ncbi:DUF6924 domain-containing protein [Streptomyces abyssomicinicus]|uniref:DUF6924 domain-containing protein n=1 Tax=Streptomyces abyssomicinicus TaxID=574929 RepID=UPI0013DFEC99|nr:hypothetical protein [Streptomyces abyssomicinicus]
MRALPAPTGLDPYATLVVRTGHHDAAAWRAVVAELRATADAPGGEPAVLLLDDPVWADATVEEVVAALRGDEDRGVVFLADADTLRGPSHPLLAATLVTRQECEDDEEYAAHVEFGAAFRVTPAMSHDVHANVALGNLGFEEFAARAAEAADGVLRPFLPVAHPGRGARTLP